MTRPAPKRHTISVDFDGVIHSYTSPWVSPEVIPDPPVDGAIDWLNKQSKKFDINVHTTRAQTPSGIVAVMEYLVENGYTGNGNLTVSDRKMPSLIYIDDRGWRFEGIFPTTQEIYDARPWNKPKRET